jgi:sialate O-acetylesterase
MSIAGGLSTNDGMAPNYFFVAGADKVFHKATAEIVGNTVVLHSSVIEPVAVRYAFLSHNVTNLCNKEGFPAFIFRTDD